MATITINNNSYNYEWTSTYIKNAIHPELAETEMTFKFTTIYGTALFIADSEQTMLDYINKDESRFIQYLERVSR